MIVLPAVIIAFCLVVIVVLKVIKSVNSSVETSAAKRITRSVPNYSSIHDPATNTIHIYSENLPETVKYFTNLNNKKNIETKTQETMTTDSAISTTATPPDTPAILTIHDASIKYSHPSINNEIIENTSSEHTNTNTNQINWENIKSNLNNVSNPLSFLKSGKP